MTIRIAINGFGRIGRQLTRLLCSERREGIHLAAINTLEDCTTAAHLLKYDSIQGISSTEIQAIANKLQIGRDEIPIFHEPYPGDLPWQEHKIDLVIECSGHFTAGWQAANHIKAGARKVIICAAAKDPDITICMGVNQNSYNPARHKIISGSSCTTNCLAPIAKIINDNWGIAAGMATFIHSYTSSQHLLDTVDDDPRRARAAGHNLIPSKTSAAHQIPLVIPELAGKFTGMAVRIPTPDVHLADFTARLHTPLSRHDLLGVLEKEACNRLRGLIQISKEPLVSIDFKNNPFSCVVDAQHTIVNQNFIKILVWHANEFSYCHRIIDLINFISKDLKD